MIYRLTILGAPRTKKNSRQSNLIRGGEKGQPCPHCRKKVMAIPFPSAAFREWVRDAVVSLPDGSELKRIRMDKELQTYRLPPDGRPAVKLLPLSIRMNMAALYYRDRDVGDLFGFHQGMGDFLQEWGIITNDLLIRTTDGSRLRKDANKPRVELTLSPIEEDQHSLLDLGQAGDGLPERQPG